MFAWTCVEQGGEHLGTCIDRFYFGSCCKLKEDNAIPDAPSKKPIQKPIFTTITKRTTTTLKPTTTKQTYGSYILLE